MRKILLCSTCFKNASKWFQLIENLHLSSFFHKAFFSHWWWASFLKEDSKLSSIFSTWFERSMITSKGIYIVFSKIFPCKRNCCVNFTCMCEDISFFWEIKTYILCLIGKTLRVITELHDSYKLQVLSSGLASKPGLLQTYKSANL